MRDDDVYVLVPKLEWPPNRFWDSPIWNIFESLPVRGVPELVWGLLFLCFFQSRTTLAKTHRKLRQTQRHGAPLLTKNLGNQDTAPSNQELGEQENGRLPLPSPIEGVVHREEAQPHFAQTATQQQLQLSPFSISIPNLTPHWQHTIQH